MGIIKSTGKKNRYFFIKGLIHIIDAIIPILTFGFYWTDFSYKFSRWAIFRTKWNN